MAEIRLIALCRDLEKSIEFSESSKGGAEKGQLGMLVTDQMQLIRTDSLPLFFSYCEHQNMGPFKGFLVVVEEGRFPSRRCFSSYNRAM